MSSADPIHHLAEPAHWEAALASGRYTRSTLGRSLQEEGFIHCSTPAQLTGVLKRHYSGYAGDLLLLTLDPQRLESPLRWDVVDATTGEAFPHLVGPLNPSAVVATRRLLPPHAVSPQSHVLRAEGIELEVLTAGAAVRCVRVADVNHPGGWVDVALGHLDPVTYRFEGGYLGAVVGRVANRLAGGRFPLDGVMVQLPTNEGQNTLHGGYEGFDRATWTVEHADDSRLRLALTSPDGDDGFPGRVDLSVTYAVRPGEVRIDYAARTDAPTPFNVTNHTYFNLDGEGGEPVDDHLLQVHASSFTPSGPDLLPTGEMRAVDDSPFDLRAPCRVGDVLALDHEQLRRGKGLDHNFVLDGDGLRLAVRLEGAGGRVLEVLTDQPGLQVYTGAHFDHTLTGPSGSTYGPRAGVALEAQGFPDAPNHEGFPDSVLRPGTPFRSTTIWRFSA